MRTSLAVFIPGLCLLAGATSAAAQTPAAPLAPMPRVFIGAGIGPSSNDASSRMRLHEDGLASMWLAEAGVSVSTRVSFGVEYSQPSAATAVTTVGAGRTQISGRQTERLVMGLIRARVGGGPRVAMDLVAGGGLLFQRHQAGSCIFAQPRCEDTSGESRETRARAYTVGLDVPIRVARNFEIVGSGRIYFLRRVVPDPVPFPGPSWQFDSKPSSRTAAIITARVIW